MVWLCDVSVLACGAARTITIVDGNSADPSATITLSVQPSRGRNANGYAEPAIVVAPALHQDVLPTHARRVATAPMEAAQKIEQGTTPCLAKFDGEPTTYMCTLDRDHAGEHAAEGVEGEPPLHTWSDRRAAGPALDRGQRALVGAAFSFVVACTVVEVTLLGAASAAIETCGSRSSTYSGRTTSTPRGTWRTLSANFGRCDVGAIPEVAFWAIVRAWE